jgi:hypothetical protein
MREETTGAWNAVAEVLGTNFQHEYMQQSLRDQLSRKYYSGRVRKRKCYTTVALCRPMIAAPHAGAGASPDSKS